MRRAVTLCVTAIALGACTRGGSSGSDGQGTGGVGTSSAARDSAAGVVGNTSGGDVQLDAPAAAATATGPFAGAGLGGSTVVTPGNNSASPPFGAAGSTPAPRVAPGTQKSGLPRPL